MSTMPPFQGGLQPTAKTWVDGRLRESVDPDDFRRGVDATANSAAASACGAGRRSRHPLMAGALAAAMSKSLMNRENPPQGAAAAVRRGWQAVERRRPTSSGQNRRVRSAQELHQAGLEALVGRRLPAARRLLERAREAAVEPDLLARIDASRAFLTAELGDLMGALRALRRGARRWRASPSRRWVCCTASER